MRDRKKPEEPQEEGAPAWMNTYGDMVTLVLTFFVLLFSFSTINAEKWEAIVNSFSGMRIVAISALDPNAAERTDENTEGKFVITSPTPAPSEPDESAEAEAALNFNELYEKIQFHIEYFGLSEFLSVEYVDEYTILLRMSDAAFFDSGKADIDDAAKAALNEVCAVIEEYCDLIESIRIEGHTDNVPMHNSVYADNWELSNGRADTVLKYVLSNTDIDPALLDACYYG
jgi:chemotaxis protein MotB